MTARMREPAAVDRNERPRKRSSGLRRRSHAIAAIAAGSTGLGLVAFGLGGRDDDYITYWAARELARSGHILNINGESIEQSSSLAHVIVLAALSLITHAPLPVLGYVLGLFGLFGTVILSARLSARISPGAEVVTAVVVALAYPLLYWATGGLETLLAAMAQLYFILALTGVLEQKLLSRRALLTFGLASIFVITVRPDTMVDAAFTVGACWILSVTQSRGSGRFRRVLPRIGFDRASLSMAILVGLALLLLAARMVVFHSVVPQPDVAKSGGLWSLRFGAEYLYHSFPLLLWIMLVVLGASGVVYIFRRSCLPGVLTLTSTFGGLGLVTASRGDWMGGARLLVPYLPGLLVVASVGVTAFPTILRKLGMPILITTEAVALALFAVNLPSVTGSQNGSWVSATGKPVFSEWNITGKNIGSGRGSYDTGGLPWYIRWNAVHLNDATFLTHTTPILRTMFHSMPNARVVTVGSGQAGMIPFTWASDFPGRLYFIDRASLTTNAFPKCPGREESSEGDMISYQVWITFAGRCAPRLPDLIFEGGTIADYPGLGTRYHVIYQQFLSLSRPGYNRNAVDGDMFLAARDDSQLHGTRN
jgi:hypothetical protein